MPESCPDCTFLIPDAADVCPHCGRPSRFPNVKAAEDAAQRLALEQRYLQAVASAGTRGCSAVLSNFVAASGVACAVIARFYREVDRLASSDKEGYATWYQLQASEVRFPSGGDWDILRSTADQAVFTGYASQLRFAALSLTGDGLSNYGDFSIVLRESMIAHRTSVLEENSTVFCKGKVFEQIPAALLGRRAAWKDRAKLCAAKLGDKLEAATSDFQSLLLQSGTTTGDDQFIEAQVYGPMTARTFEKVVLLKSKNRHNKTIVKALRERLAKVGVSFEDRR